jgi:hypothetical protein
MRQQADFYGASDNYEGILIEQNRLLDTLAGPLQWGQILLLLARLADRCNK